MAFRTWGRLLLTALGVSVLAGAGQLGVAYGFGIVRLTGAFTGTTVNQWPAQLVWVGWFAANAAVAGAVLTGRLARGDAPAASTGRQLAIGGAAALGATVIAPLCMQPARAAELVSVDPVWAVGICAVLGAVIGAGAAIAVLLRPALGWNMAAVAGVVWLLALISVLPSLGTTGPLPTVRLGVLEPSWLSDSTAQRLALLLLPTVALLAGAATAGLARWRGQDPLISGATGVAGPVLVAFAYLTAGPGDSVDRYQVTPYYGSLIAILAGALGAAAAALLRWPAGARTPDSQAIEPSDILDALPTGPALPNAASPSPANDPDAAERTAARTAAPSAGLEPAGGDLTGATSGPRAAGGSDGVRTVPAHWDWPADATSGQHGVTPAAPATSQAWRTDPTGEFTAGRRTPPASRDDVTSPPATAAIANTGTADAGATSTETAAVNPTGTETAGARATDAKRTTTPTTTTDGTSTGTADTGAANTATADTGAATTATADTGAAGTATADTGAASTVTADANRGSAATVDAGAAALDAGAAALDAGAAALDAGAASTATVDTSGAEPGTADAPLTVKPRRARKAKASPLDATIDPADSTSGSNATDEPAAGAAEPDRESRDTTSGPASGATPTTTAPAEAAAPTSGTGRTRTPVTPTTTGPTRTPIPTTSGPTRTPMPIISGPTKTPTPTTTGPTGVPATPTSAKGAAVDPPRTPDVASAAPTTRPVGKSAAAGVGGTTSARPAGDSAASAPSAGDGVPAGARTAGDASAARTPTAGDASAARTPTAGDASAARTPTAGD
ncbi:hypothetical protein, partial [Micromonospora sp. DT231]|uniref:hypothetical protein n=1 Tax=Micromonospora sp. DT231 TaxID=3416526 RepID=UPI003CEB5F38